MDIVADVELPGGSTRFDYQSLDVSRGRLVVTHMNDGTVLVVDVKDASGGKVLKELPNIPTARGVATAEEAGLFFVTSTPNQVVIVDANTLTEVKRVTSGKAPDGIAWDPMHKMVGVSDQQDGALSILADSGNGARTALKLGADTGNVVFDAGRGWFWITAVTATSSRVVGVDPTTAKITSSIDLPGCDGGHGLRIHPDGKSALVACEGNDVLARVALEGDHAISIADTGSGPDVMAIDPGLSWLYVAAESGDLTVFDLSKPGLVLVGHDKPGDHSHSVSVDPATHRVYFPLLKGKNGKPVLRIMQPKLAPRG